MSKSKDIAKLTEEVSKLADRVKKLECPHEHTSVEKANGTSGVYIEVCRDCGESLRTVSTEEKEKREAQRLEEELNSKEEQFQKQCQEGLDELQIVQKKVEAKKLEFETKYQKAFGETRRPKSMQSVKITRCCDCLYFGIDGGPSSTMVCNHPSAPEGGYIISHPECDNGFPPKCPLIKKKGE